MQDPQEAHVVTLGPVLDVRAAVPLHRELLELRGRAVTLNAGSVERVGGQCAAILLSAARSWRADGQVLGLAEPSDDFESGWTLLGLDMAEFETTDPAETAAEDA